jgi:hypothetical protein
MRPMKEFDPSTPAMVHDRLNDRTFEWKPEWQGKHDLSARKSGDGLILLDGLLLDGWQPVVPP